MDVIVFSDRTETRGRFLRLERSRTVRVRHHPRSELNKVLRTAPQEAFVYLDVSGYEVHDRERVLKYLRRYGKQRYGVIDPEGRVSDAGLLFLEGASDYTGAACVGQITLERVRKALLLRAHTVEAEREPEAGSRVAEYIVSGNDWERILPDREYTFCLMYIALDRKVQLKRNLSDKLIAEADSSFRSYIEGSVSRSRGRLWIWNDFEGLVLFPFDGKQCDAVLVCIRLLLSRTIYSVENPFFNSKLSFSISLHLGNTVYRRSGDTGTIVSDSINTVFNIGRKFGERGNLYITSQVYDYAPPGLRGQFCPEGRFEGFEILRMRLPL